MSRRVSPGAAHYGELAEQARQMSDVEIDDILAPAPPHSDEAEQAVIGSVLKDSAAIVDVGWLRPDDFVDPRHKRIWKAMAAVASEGQPPDIPLTSARLRQHGDYEMAGGLDYLAQIDLATPSAAHIAHYAAVVERTSVMRQLVDRAQSIAVMAYRNNLDPDTALEKAEQLLLSVANRRVARFERSGLVLSGFARRLADAMGTLSDLAARYGGEVQWLAEGYLALGELVIVPGPPESFKSWLMADLARAVSVDGALWLGSLQVAHGKVVYFEQERAKNLVYQARRLAAGWGQNLDAMLTVEPCGIDLCDEDCAAALAAMLEQERPLLVIFNSYKAIFRGRPADSADVSRALQWLGNVADRLNLVVCVVDGDNKLGALGHVRGMAAHADSIQKEYEADAILHVERKRDEVGRGSGPASVYVGKRRQGDSGAPFQFDVVRLDDERAKALWLDETTIEHDPPARHTGRARVLDAVPSTTEGKSRQDIATAAGVKPGTASAYLLALEREGLVEPAAQYGNWRRKQPSIPSIFLKGIDGIDGSPEPQLSTPSTPSIFDTIDPIDGANGTGRELGGTGS